ncbi:hypothetical protein DSAG12_02307 [Promethearchaeum syntrophicum]|uniref:Uncharacterized protein n=1 Tax=Promethearchaeum syntrophicum TaxID=2594042 RepID=A0A5B9DC83_9ARCH|nr:hypothetical protein [Candidatus Prometheoarchaeum syntrophicum]QEE16477.1 hypothetical protein DSAG12_02307 [Candidatus Prometheoarchaeum syntrophicum]
MMLHAIYIIDGETGLSIIEYRDYPQSKEFGDFFQVINDIMDDIRSNIQENRALSNFSRILMIDKFSIIIHYYHPAKILLCCLSDVDDIKEKILSVLDTLGRRFWQKHSMDIDKFLQTNKKEIFNSFIIEIEMLTRDGRIAENRPKLIVSDSTLEKLLKMEIISEEDLSIANICRGSLSPLQISEKTNIPHEKVAEILKKLKKIDIIKSPLAEIAN